MNENIFEQYDFSLEKFPVILKYVKITNRSGKWINWHNYIELLYITEGEGTIWCHDKAYSLSKDDLFVINSNLLHYTQTESELKYYCIIIDSDFLSQNEIFAENLEYNSFVASDSAKQKLKELIAELETKQPYQFAAVKAKLLDLVIYISRSYSTETENTLLKTSSTDKNIKKAIAYIQSHLTEPLTVKLLANYLHLNSDYFSYAFKKAIGVSAITYINHLRCYNAKKLLQTKQYSIHEVALKSGFENASYFSKAFKKYIGVLPSKY